MLIFLYLSLYWNHEKGDSTNHNVIKRLQERGWLLQIKVPAFFMH